MFKRQLAEPLHDPIAASRPVGTTGIRTTPCPRCACRGGIRGRLRAGSALVPEWEARPPNPSLPRCGATRGEGDAA